MLVPTTAAQVLPGETLLGGLGHVALITDSFTMGDGKIRLQVLVSPVGVDAEPIELVWGCDPDQPFNVLVNDGREF